MKAASLVAQHCQRCRRFIGAARLGEPVRLICRDCHITYEMVVRERC